MNECKCIVEYTTTDNKKEYYREKGLFLPDQNIKYIKEIPSTYQDIKLNNNNLISLPPLHDNIELLELDSNNFYRLPKDVFKVKDRLGLDDNQLKFIDRPLAKIRISMNKITRIDHVKDKVVAYSCNQITYRIKKNYHFVNNPIYPCQYWFDGSSTPVHLIEPFCVAMFQYLTATSLVKHNHYLRPWNINFLFDI